MKKFGKYMCAFITGMLICIALLTVTNTITPVKYVYQYDLGHGYKITIDWDEPIPCDEGVVYYGCVNDRTTVTFIWRDAETWNRMLYERDINYESKKTKKEEWRW